MRLATDVWSPRSYNLLHAKEPLVPLAPLSVFLRAHLRKPWPGKLAGSTFIPLGHDARPTLKEVGRIYDDRYGTRCGERTLQRVTSQSGTWVTVWLADRILTLFGVHYLDLYPEGPIVRRTDGAS